MTGVQRNIEGQRRPYHLAEYEHAVADPPSRSCGRGPTALRLPHRVLPGHQVLVWPTPVPNARIGVVAIAYGRTGLNRT